MIASRTETNLLRSCINEKIGAEYFSKIDVNVMTDRNKRRAYFSKIGCHRISVFARFENVTMIQRGRNTEIVSFLETALSARQNQNTDAKYPLTHTAKKSKIERRNFGHNRMQ